MYAPFGFPQMLSQLFLSLNVDAKVESNPVKTYSQIKNKSRVFSKSMLSYLVLKKLSLGEPTFLILRLLLQQKQQQQCIYLEKYKVTILYVLQIVIMLI